MNLKIFLYTAGACAVGAAAAIYAPRAYYYVRSWLA